MRQPEHREITRRGVAELFREDGSGRIAGLVGSVYLSMLNRAQAYQDRVFDRRTVVGPTLHPATWNPGIQRAHALADPRLAGAANLRIINDYVLAELMLARAAADRTAEMARLGAAIHAVQDSYSSAHTWRADAVYEGDRYAPVQSLNVFHPVLRDTHDQRFDRPPLDGGTVRAAVGATTELLATYESSRDDAEPTALRQLVDRLFRPGERGVEVNHRPDRAWQTERDRRLHLDGHVRRDSQQVHFPRARIERTRPNRLSRRRDQAPRQHDRSGERERER